MTTWHEYLDEHPEGSDEWRRRQKQFEEYKRTGKYAKKKGEITRGEIKAEKERIRLNSGRYIATFK